MPPRTRQLIILVIVSLATSLLAGGLLMRSYYKDIRDENNESEILTADSYKNEKYVVALSIDARLLASSPASDFDNSAGIISVRDVLTGQHMTTLSAENATFCSLRFADDGNTLASADRRGTIRLWDITTGKERLTLTGHAAPVNRLSFTHDSAKLASGGRDSTVKVWDVKDGRDITTIRLPFGGIRALKFSPDNKYLAIGGGTSSRIGHRQTVASKTEVMLWDTVHNRMVASYSGHSSFVTALTFSPNGKTLASAGFDQIVRLWDVETGSEIKTYHIQPLREMPITCHCLSFNNDGNILAAAGGHSTAGVMIYWDINSGNKSGTLKEFSQPILAQAFSLDGRHLTTVTISREIDRSEVVTDAERKD